MAQAIEQIPVMPAVHCVECGVELDTVSALSRFTLANDPTCDECVERWIELEREHEREEAWRVPVDGDSALDRWIQTQAGHAVIRRAGA